MAYEYDLIVIGGGAAGLVASKFAAGVGKRTALIEKGRLGGECTLYGCVPSKTLVRSASLLHQMNRLHSKGLAPSGPCRVSTQGVMAHVRSVVEEVAQGHGQEKLERLGIRVIFGDPSFVDNHVIRINGRAVSARSFIVCTGSSPLVPPIEGIDRTPYLTNQNLFAMESLPQSMIVLGAGPIGIEMAQAFAYLGVAVTVVEQAEQVLIREDRELANLLSSRLSEQGIHLRMKTKAVRLADQMGAAALTVEDATTGRQEVITASAILVAVGRKANVDGVGLEAAGIDFSSKGIKTDRRLRTTAGNIYACGDVVGPYQFSHMAEYQARIAARNALFPLKTSADYGNYAWCTFTDPEFAHAGLTESEARQAYGERIKVFRWRYNDTDRARTEAEPFGMGKFVCDNSYRLLGAHILGERAGDLIHEAQIVKTQGIPFHRLDSVIHVYPTLSDVVRQPAKMSRIERLQSSLFVKVARGLLSRRPTPP